MIDADIIFCNDPERVPNEDGKTDIRLAEELAAAVDEFKRRYIELILEKQERCSEVDAQALANILMKPLAKMERQIDEELRRKDK